MMDGIKRSKIQTDIHVVNVFLKEAIEGKSLGKGVDECAHSADHAVPPSLVYKSLSSINIFSASSRRRLRLYPATVIEMGSPSGATCSTLINSPGTQPISINCRNRSFFSKEWILAIVPGSNSDNLFILCVCLFLTIYPPAMGR